MSQVTPLRSNLLAASLAVSGLCLWPIGAVPATQEKAEASAGLTARAFSLAEAALSQATAEVSQAAPQPSSREVPAAAGLVGSDEHFLRVEHATEEQAEAPFGCALSREGAWGAEGGTPGAPALPDHGLGVPGISHTPDLGQR